jgi:hypothetical protein
MLLRSRSRATSLAAIAQSRKTIIVVQEHSQETDVLLLLYMLADSIMGLCCGGGLQQNGS